MSQFKYEPINSSCVNKYYNTVGNDLNWSSEGKGKRKALAFMNTGQGKYGDIGSYEEIPACVFPPETLKLMNMEMGNCILRDTMTNEVVSTNFTKSQGGILDQDPNKAQSQINAGTGVYPSAGCTVSARDAAGPFPQAVSDSQRVIESENQKELACLRAKIEELHRIIDDLQYNQVPTAYNAMNDAINNYNRTKADCDYQTWWRGWATNTGIPWIKGYIRDLNNYLNWLRGDYWNAVNNYGKWLSQYCNGNSYGLWKNQTRDNYCMDDYAHSRNAGDPQVTWSCHGDTNQRFNIINRELIQSQYNGMCLDVWRWGTGAGTQVVQWPCHGGNNQRWFTTGNDDIRPRHAPNMCLDSYGGQGNDGARLVIWPCHGGRNQKWKYTPYGNFRFDMRNLDGGGSVSPPTFYKHCSYAGSYIKLSEGDYDLGKLRQIARQYNYQGDINDDISSVRVPAGYRVTLYEHDNFQGRTLDLTGDESCLVGRGFNDLTSSIKITRA